MLVTSVALDLSSELAIAAAKSLWERIVHRWGRARTSDRVIPVPAHDQQRLRSRAVVLAQALGATPQEAERIADAVVRAWPETPK